MAQARTPEVSWYNDRVTGVRIAQLTMWPCVNLKFYFHDEFWTPDSRTLLFYSIPGPRGSRADIYRVNTRGHDLVQLTDNLAWSGVAMGADGQHFYYNSDKALWRADLETGTADKVVDLPQEATAWGGASITWDGRVYAVQGTYPEGKSGIARVYLERGQVDLVHLREGSISHCQVEPSAGEFIAYQMSVPDYPYTYWYLPVDGGEVQPFRLERGTGHWMWVGESKRVISTFYHPRGALATIGMGDAEPTTVIETPEYLWHAATSRDGVWAVSDTNWPDRGIQLIHLPSARYETLCMSDSTGGASNLDHPHPSFSPDGRWVVFQSTRTGVPQVYLLEVPEEVKSRLAG